MENVTIGFIGLGAGIVLLLLRVQIGVALGLVSFIGIAVLLNMRAAWGIITAIPFNFVGDWNLTAIPMFLLMGFIASEAGLSSGLFRTMRMLLSWLPGGLAVASVGASAVLAAASGSSVATSSAFARIATPEMLRYRYDPGLATGVIAAAGTLGSLIPPSILMVLYGIFAETSIVDLLIAGIIPGLLTAGVYTAMILIRCKINPELAPRIHEEKSAEEIRRERWQSLGEIWPLFILVFGIIGGLYGGVVTPTEAAVVAVVYALLVGAVIYRELPLSAIPRILRSSAVTSAIVLSIIAAAGLYGRIILQLQVPAVISDFVVGAIQSPWLFIILVNVLLLLVGMFLEAAAAILIFTPILLPIATTFGFDPVHFGVIMVVNLAMGMFTPPVGLNLFIASGIARIGVPQIARGVVPFVVILLVDLLIISFLPWLSLVFTQ